MIQSDGIPLAFVTVLGSIFIAELTDKDALLLLTLATKGSPWRVFAAGSIAFTISSAIIVLIGSGLLLVIPIFWIKIAGGVIMLGYAFFQYLRGLSEEKGIENRGEKLVSGKARNALSAFLAILLSLIILDLAGDATELLTIVFVAQYGDLLLVFLAAACALVLASAIEVMLGNRLGRLLSAQRIRYLSIVIFLVIGSLIIISAVM